MVLSVCLSVSWGYYDLDPFMNRTDSDCDDYKIRTCIATLKVWLKVKKKRNTIFKFMYNVLLDTILLAKVCFLK